MSLFEISSINLIEYMQSYSIYNSTNDALKNDIFETHYIDECLHMSVGFDFNKNSLESLDEDDQLMPSKINEFYLDKKKLEKGKATLHVVHSKNTEQINEDLQCEEMESNKTNPIKEAQNLSPSKASTKSEYSSKTIRKSGRKRGNISASLSELNSMLIEIITKLNDKISKLIWEKERSDVINTTIIRELRNISKKIVVKFVTK